MTTDPVSPDYVPAYSDPRNEIARLEICVLQQVEDLFTTISRISDLAQRESMIHEDHLWRDLRGGLRCWRLALRGSR